MSIRSFSEVVHKPIHLQAPQNATGLLPHLLIMGTALQGTWCLTRALSCVSWNTAEGEPAPLAGSRFNQSQVRHGGHPAAAEFLGEPSHSRNCETLLRLCKATMEPHVPVPPEGHGSWTH